jgi:hypothetical protein
MSWATHPPDDDTVWIPPKTFISNYEGWLYLDYALYFVNNWAKLPVVAFTACSNNNYMKTSECIGWTTVFREKGGGIACYAEAGIGHGPDGNSFIHYGIGWMETHLFEELVNTQELGEAWGNCISQYYNAHEVNGRSLSLTDYKTMLEFSMFGDPTVKVQDGDDPQVRSINMPAQLTILERIYDNFPVLARIIEQILARIQ